jgi:YYY domain-containing protein
VRLALRPVAGAAVGARRWPRAAAKRLWVIATLVVVTVVLPMLVARIGSTRLMLDDHERALYAAHGTWHRMFALDGLADHFSVPLWALALALLGLVGLPYVWLAAQTLSDRGFGLARPIGLLLVTWVVWWLASLRLMPFTRETIAFAALLVAAGAAAITATRWAELTRWLAARWRLLLIEEAVFWALFTVVVLVRWSNPDLWHPTLGGEKPMDFAYLNAVLKSTHFPPFDPWFAGGQMNYYYFGFVLVGVLVKATSVSPAIAYNLAIPTLVAFLAGAAFSATHALADVGSARAGRRPALVALFGALFVTVLGNLGELRVLFQAITRSVPESWWYWNASRAIQHPASEPGPITEFPSFTYLYADLHAHAIALPYTACALTLAFAFVRGGRHGGGRKTGILQYGLIALVVGALWPLNTWDFPTYAGIALVAFCFAELRRSQHVTPAALGRLVVRASLFVPFAFLLFLPFHRRNGDVFEGVALWHGSRTRLGDYLTIHGLFLFAIVSGIVVDLCTARDANALVRTARLALRNWERLGRYRALHRALVKPSRTYRLAPRVGAVAFVLAIVLTLAGQGVPALVVVLGTMGVLALVRRRNDRATTDDRALRQMAIVLFLVGLALTLSVEFLVAKNIDIGRTNTVFKTYLQVWVLWGVAAAVLVTWVYEQLPRLPRAWRALWRLAFVCLLSAAALYPILATRAKIDDRFAPSVGRTLDGTAFMGRAVLHDQGRAIPLVYDREAIRWVLETLDGSPVFAEVNTFPILYGWGSRYAMFTGNPDVVGWDYHERQQRPPQSMLVTKRIEDLQSAYRTTDARLAYSIFRRYGVRYFVVGPLERAYFPQGQSKWRSGQGSLWNLVYENPGVRIYQLAPPAVVTR